MEITLVWLLAIIFIIGYWHANARIRRLELAVKVAAIALQKLGESSHSNLRIFREVGNAFTRYEAALSNFDDELRKLKDKYSASGAIH